jgi:hypothetical protein
MDGPDFRLFLHLMLGFSSVRIPSGITPVLSGTTRLFSRHTEDAHGLSIVEQRGARAARVRIDEPSDAFRPIGP